MGRALPVRAIGLDAHGGYAPTHGEQYPDFGDNLRITLRIDQGPSGLICRRPRRKDDPRGAMLVWSEFGRRPEENGSGGC